MKPCMYLLLAGCSLRASLSAEDNPLYTFSIDGLCGETIVGPPGSTYDDGTAGLPYFNTVTDGTKAPRLPIGYTWNVVLTTENNFVDSGAYSWMFAVGVEGPLRLTDITLDGTTACYLGEYPECKRGAAPARIEITGPPEGGGPQTEENRGAISHVILKLDGLFTLLPKGDSIVCRIRVSAEFPANEGDELQSRIFFTKRISSLNTEFLCSVSGPNRVGARIVQGKAITLDEGNPPLKVEECVVRLKASSVSAFLRCDPNDDGRLTIADAVWILNELFLGGARTRCSISADCNADGDRDITDAVYGLTHLFLGGPAPPAPYPSCGRIDVPLDGCPPGSTACP